MLNPTLFLDRDGTINKDLIGSYVSSESQFELLPNVSIALQKARLAGFKLAVITNQAGIAKGLTQHEDLIKIHKKMQELIRKELNDPKFQFDTIEFCPHRPEDGCACRKPQPAMAMSASQKLSSDMSRSFFIGDKMGDLLCAENLRIRSILVLTGYGKETQKELDRPIQQPQKSQQGIPSQKAAPKPWYIADDLFRAVEYILSSVAN